MNVRRKSFLIGIFLMPLFIAGMAILPSLLARKAIEGKGQTKKVAIIDLTGQLYPEVKKMLEEQRGGPKYVVEEITATGGNLEEKRKELNERVQKKQLDSYVVIGKKLINSHIQYEDSPEHKIRCYTRNVTDIGESERIQGAVRRALINLRLRNMGIDPAVSTKASWNINIETMEVKKGEAKKSQGLANIFGAFAFVMLLFFGLQISGQTLMQGVIEEKNSRIMEVLVSSVSPKELMRGKILGLGAVGLTMMVLWSAVGYTAARLRHFDIATLPNVGYMLVFFLLGYAFFGTLMATVGSVCNSEKEAQQMMMPIMLSLVLPLMVWFNIAQSPDSTFSRVLSVIPFTVPMIMMLRIAIQTPPASQIIISIIVMLVSIHVCLLAATKVFRTGILMYGKKPRLREIVRWVRYK
ncbi:ABC transporter permease [bacterium]|nr:ABC transporter permease [bacterium]